MPTNEAKSTAVKFTVGFLCAALLSTGCAPLRKKFLRQKKADKVQEVMPVLEPVDYPANVETPQKRYARCYGLWKVWHNELSESTYGPIDNAKHVRYIFSQDIQQLEKMSGVLSGADQDGLRVVVAEMRSALADFDEPDAMRNMVVIRRKIRTSDKTVRNNFSPSLKKQLQFIPSEQMPSEYPQEDIPKE